MRAGVSTRPVRPDEALTIVVIPLVGGAALQACLAALLDQPAREILLVAREAPDPPAHARLIVVPAGSNVPERRMIGLKAATAPFVAFVEDTCVPCANWSADLCASFTEADVLAAGGPVRIDASIAPRLKALAIAEYSRFAADKGRAFDVNALAGANFAVRRETFDSAALPNGLVDNLVFDAVRQVGGRIVFQPAAEVTYAAGPPEQARLSTRFHHGRIYGGLLAARQPLARRLLLALTALAAPAVLIARNVRHASPQLFRSPSTFWWIVLMQCAWGCGEVMGKLTGRVGASFKGWA